jgi:hypothetical protein
MSKVMAAALALTFSLAAVSSADAAGGCGAGWHRGPHGGCLRNLGETVVIAPTGRAAVVVAPGPGPVIVGRACPVGFHLGPNGHRCWHN